MNAALESAAIVSRFILAFAFAAAAAPKLVARHEFEHAIRNYALLPQRLVPLVAVWLPRLELACAVALLLGVFLRPVALTAFALLVSFSVAVGVNLARGRSFDCGCQGGVAPREIGWGIVAADVVLAAMAAIVAAAEPRPLAIDGVAVGGNQSLSNLDAIALLLLASVAFAAYQVAEELGRLRSASRRLEGSEL